jgi:hypothetical protein
LPGQNIIQLGFDIDTLTAEKKQVLDIVADLFDKLGKYDGAKFDPLKGGGLGDFRKAIQDTGKAMGEYQQTAEKYNQTITDQVTKHQAAKKAVDDLGASQKANAGSADSYSTSQDRLRRQATDLKVSMEDVAASIRRVRDEYNEGKISISQYKEKLDPLLAQQLSLKVANTDVTKTLTVLEKQFQAVGGSTAQLEARLKDLQHVYDNLSPEGRNADAGKTLLKEIQDVDAAFKELKGDTGRFQDNVGNYAGALAPGFAALRGQLEEVNKQMAEIEARGKPGVTNLNPVGFDRDRHKSNTGPTAFAGGSSETSSILETDSAAYQKLTLQQKILEGSLERQRIGFANSNQEMRNAKATLDSLALAGANNTEGFEKMNLAYTSAEQKIKDLHQEQTILSSDAPALTALTGIAKGLGGAYALGAGAAGLFADGDEKLEKELNKLVAVMTFLQGLEEASKALKDRNALSTALEESATKALNVVKELEVKWFGKEKTVLQENIAAKAADTGATEVNTEAAALNTTAVEGMTVANEEAAAATLELSTALLATGLGAAILAIGVGVGFLVEHLIELSEADTKAAQRSADLAESLEKTNEIMLEQIKLSDESAENQRKNLENAITLAEKNKQNETDLLKIRQDQSDLDRKKAEDDLKKLAKTGDLGDAYKIVQGKVDAATKSVDSLGKKQIELNGIADIYKKVSDPTADYTLSQARFDVYAKYKKNITEEDLKDQLEAAEKEKTATKKFLEDSKVLLDAYDKSNIDATGVSIDEKQHADEELRKITLDTAIQEANATKAKNELILNDDRSTLAQRLAAIRSNGEEEIKIAAATRNDALKRPGAIAANGDKSADAVIAENDYQKRRVEISDSTEQKMFQTTVEYNDKRLSFLNDILKNEIETDAAAQKAITDNGQKELEDRLGALQANIADRAKLIAADYQLQITLAKEHNKTQEELDKIESNRQKALAELAQTTQKEIYDIVVSWGEKRVKAIEELNKTGTASNTTAENYNKEEDALNQSLIHRDTSYTRYLTEKKLADQQYAVDKAKADIKDDEDALKRLKDFQDSELKVKLDAAQFALDAAKGEGNDDEIANAQAKVDALKAIETKANADTVAATAKLEKDKTALHQAQVKPIEEADALLYSRQQELQKATYDFAKDLVDSSYENEINKIQAKMDLQDQASAEQIAAIQRSSLSQQNQAAEVTILSAQQRARDTQYKLEQKKDKIAEAKFDRDVAVAQVVWNTAKAIMKDTAGIPFPLSLAIAATDAALGAVQVATILAKPIPAYAEGVGIPGRGRHPGGEALVGEEYRPELVTPRGGRPFIVDQPTLLNLPADSMVQPLDISNMVFELAGIGMMRGAMMINSHGELQDNRVEAAIQAQTAQLSRVFRKNQRKILNVVHIHNEMNGLSVDYINTKILGKKR